MPNFASISTYRSEADKIIRYGASTSETAVRRAFFNLINAYARPRDLLLVEELDYFNPRRRKTVRPDGTLKNILRLDYGFWESKDSGDKLHEEIAKKFDKGYPDSNILFEDTQTAILYQDGHQVFADTPSPTPPRSMPCSPATLASSIPRSASLRKPSSVSATTSRTSSAPSGA